MFFNASVFDKVFAGDVPAKAAQLEVGRLYFFCVGFRGDWKAMTQIFNLTRHYNDNKVWPEKNVIIILFVVGMVFDG